MSSSKKSYSHNLTFDLLCQHEHQQLDTLLKQKDNTIRNWNWRGNLHIKLLKLKCACSERLGDTDWMAKINVRTAVVSIISHQRQARSFFSLHSLRLSLFVFVCWVSLHIFFSLLFLMFLLVHIFTSSFQSAKWFNGCISVSSGCCLCICVECRYYKSAQCLVQHHPCTHFIHHFIKLIFPFVLCWFFALIIGLCVLYANRMRCVCVCVYDRMRMQLRFVKSMNIEYTLLLAWNI